MLLSNAYVVWITFNYLRQKISETSKRSTAP